MKIIITGGMGFVGSNLIDKLDREGNQITVFDNFSTNVQTDSDGFDILNIDLSDRKMIDQINLKSADILIHLAGPSSGPASAKDPEGTIDKSNKVMF
ncbi:uncharacterized protein METZ01_LOCUS370006, partial [marine metagenome]